MPNGDSDCCGTCWFNRSLGGERGSANFHREVPNHCEIRNLDIPDPFYTYCANHPYHRPDRDPTPIGPVYVHRTAVDGGGREKWQPSPDTEEIRQHLLDIVRLPREHVDEGYHFYTSTRFRPTPRPSCSRSNGVTSGSCQRWKRSPGARNRSAFAPTSRRPYDLFENDWRSATCPNSRLLPAASEQVAARMLNVGAAEMRAEIAKHVRREMAR